MIFDIYETDNSITHESLEQLDSLLLSEMFLCGLGEGAELLPFVDDFPVVTDIVKANEMMTSQEIWDMPEPWPYQYFVGITGDEWGRLQFNSGLNKEEAKKRANIVGRGMDKFSVLLKEKVDRRYEELNIYSYLIDKTVFAADKETLEFIINNSFKNEIISYIHNMIHAAFLGGIGDSPIYKRFYEAFMTGGIPCGWVGPLPEDGGNPRECIQLLHFGSR